MLQRGFQGIRRAVATVATLATVATVATVHCCHNRLCIDSTDPDFPILNGYFLMSKERRQHKNPLFECNWLGSGSGIADDRELISTLTTGTDIVSSVANALLKSLVKQQQQRQLQRWVSPELLPDHEPEPEPEPVKKTRKRKAAEDIREVDLGLRNLRRRK